MITFDRINRRTHLYLGLFLLPWVIMYGASSFLVSHQAWFRSEQPPGWELLFEREYHHPINDRQDLREVAGEILKDLDLEGAFWTQRPKPGELRIDRFGFLGSTRLTYLIKEQKLRGERQRMPWNQVLQRMHFRGGFLQDSFWDDLWAVIVDVVCISILLWIVSGLLLWWRLVQTRVWGALAVGAGILSFLLLVWKL
jgi:hypothetical protein